MRLLLRIISMMTGLAVALTALTIAQLASSGDLAVMARMGAIGIVTIVAWLLIVTAGPVAAIQLWRLRRVGLFLTAMLCLLAAAYYLAGLLFSRDALVRPIISAEVANDAVAATLLSRPARRACVDQDSEK